MLVIPYDVEKHEKLAKAILSYRGMDPFLTNDLPQYGLVALEGDRIVAMGFLRRIEGPYAMLDSYITNPEFDSEPRNRALDLITYKLINLATSNGVNKLIAFSVESTIIERALMHGFGRVSHTMAIYTK